LKNRILLILPLFLFQLSIGQSTTYQSLLLDKKYSKNANSCIRHYSTHINIEAQDKMYVEHTQIITVFNKSGDRDIDAFLHYDDNVKVKNIEAKIYDTYGNEIKKIKKRDFRDVSAVDGGTLYSDNRVYFLDYTPLNYPYTVEFTYRIKTSNTAFIRPWRPVRNYYQSIEFSEFVIENHTDAKLRYKTFNFDFLKGLKVNDSENHISCKANAIEAIKKENYSPSLNSFSPKVNFALSKFNLEGVSGTASNWDEMGKWQYEKLIKGRDRVTKKTKQEILNLTQGVDDPLEKVKIVYQYVQDHTRYISVQVGIGGWQPIDAETVDKVKYGDCKGLTNYTKALLKIVGVDAKYSVVFAGTEKIDIDEDFASIQGNHVILNVPLDNQDLWLECTSQDIPFGFLGTHTDDRKVLVIDENGGQIKSTDSYYAKDNFQNITADIKLNKSGSLEAEFSILSKGTQFNRKYRLAGKPDHEIIKYYKSYYSHLKQLEIKSFQFAQDDEKVEFVETLKLTAGKYCSKFGNRFMFKPNVLNQSIGIPDKYDNRKTPFVISRGFFDKDQLTFIFQEGMQIESMPKPIKIETKFGAYTAEVSQDETGKMIYKRSMLLKQGKFSNEDYNAFREFMKSVHKADNSKIILVDKT
jgi:transglutaminase-like putative cysteine protease